jgi:hypothetical protein
MHAPLGNYTYTVSAGDYPGTVWARDSFNFDVSADRSATQP